jgi:4-hydroxyphenylpyruvate dioxygenase
VLHRLGMKIDHVRFFVENAAEYRDWLITKLGFRAIAQMEWQHSQVEVVQSGEIIFAVCAPKTLDSPVTNFLKRHPAGVSDVVFCVDDLDAAVAQALPHTQLLQLPQAETTAQGHLKWATVLAWGSLAHTFVERRGITPLLPQAEQTGAASALVNLQDGKIDKGDACSWFTQIDHVVLNVPQGKLDCAIAWYANVLGLQSEQTFQIQTPRSGLCSRVMRHPSGRVQIPINEPTSPTSQIQEFLNFNQGAGIQHIALETANLVGAIADLRDRGLALIDVPDCYYSGLRSQASPLATQLLDQIQTQKVLAEWQSKHYAVLLQTFTQPIFQQPTFFFELIQRQEPDSFFNPACGFGEGNFQALFEAIEREQLKRAKLEPSTPSLTL